MSRDSNREARTRGEFIHKHTVIFSTLRRPLSFSFEFASIHTHYAPFESAAEAEPKVDSTPLTALCQ